MDLNMDPLSQVTSSVSSASVFTPELQMSNVGVQTRIYYPPAAADAEEWAASCCCRDNQFSHFSCCGFQRWTR